MRTATNRWTRMAMTVCAMLVALLLAASYRFLISRGVFAKVTPVAPTCHTLPGAVNDIVVDPAARLAFLASPQDGISAYAYDKAGARPEKLAGSPPGFHPTALALYRASGGEATLYAVVRRGEAYFIVSFRVTQVQGKPKLEEKSSIGGRILNEPSAIAPVDEARFYVVNRHTSSTALGRWLDDSFLLPRANVLYFDGMIFREVVKQLNSPAGAVLSPDTGHLIVGEFYPRRLVSFLRNPFSGEVKDAEALSLKAGPGHLETAADGLIVAATPKAGNGAVYRVSLKDGVPQAAVPLYVGRDGEIAAAAAAGRRLLIGTAAGLKDCALPKQ
jgi:arylesterase / paraoxonase